MAARRGLRPAKSRASAASGNRLYHTPSTGRVQSSHAPDLPDRTDFRRDQAHVGKDWHAFAGGGGRFCHGRSGLAVGRHDDVLESFGFLVSPLVRDFGPLFVTSGWSPSEEERNRQHALEVTVLATQAALEVLAERIERAYQLRRSGWYRGCSSAGVWSTAAAILVQLHEDDATLPVDPELYVAVQPVGGSFDDPWVGLTQPSATRRYRRRVRAMIRALRSELRAEVRHAERRIARGETLEKVLKTPSKRLSPLGCYIVAHRAGCPALGERFRLGAVEQHRCCPLYRAASLHLIPPELYPGRERSADEDLVAMTRQRSPQFHLN
jgi:hypothetical protein